MGESLKDKYVRSRRLDLHQSHTNNSSDALLEIDTNNQTYRKVDINKFRHRNINNDSLDESQIFSSRRNVTDHNFRSNLPSGDNLYGGKLPTLSFNHSPIRTLRSHVTPSKFRPKKIYKFTGTGSFPKLDRARVDQSCSRSEKQGLFSRLRNYMSRFYMKSGDFDLESLRNSAGVTEAVSEQEKRNKRVKFDLNDIKPIENLNDEDLNDDLVDDIITRKSPNILHPGFESNSLLNKTNNNSETLLKDPSDSVSQLNLFQGQVKQLIDMLENRFIRELAVLNGTIKDVREESRTSRRLLEESLKKEISLTIDQHDKRISTTQEKREYQLQLMRDQILKANEISEEKEKQFQRKLKEIEHFSFIKDAKREIDDSRSRFDRKRRYLLHERIKLGISMKENENAYNSYLKENTLSSFLNTLQGRRKYQKVKDKLNEYSNLLASSGNEKDWNVSDIQDLASKLRNSLKISQARKQQKVKLLGDYLYKMRFRLGHNSKTESHNLCHFYQKKQTLLNELDSITSLLIDLTSILGQLSEIEISSKYKSYKLDISFSVN